MPMITTKRWELIHNWESEGWKIEGKWTEENMMDEINALDEFRLQNIKDMSLKELVDAILESGGVRKGNIEFDFRTLKSIFNSWKFFTTCCENYGRVWVAQDESYTECFIDKNRNCHDGSLRCLDYKPMIKAKSLEELLKGEVVQFT